jgi:RNA polymerase sigma-70 factor (ECF subfamily)
MAWSNHTFSGGFRPAATQRGGMSDLILRIASDRSSEAFSALFKDFRPRIKAFMMRQGADASLADELAQETLLTVWNKAALYSREKGSPTNWIFTIARNLRIDRLRRETPWQELTDHHAETVEASTIAPDDAMSLTQRQQRVQAALATLPDEQREVLILAYVEALPHSEIARRLSLPLGTVKSRVRLAYQKIRSALEDLR